MTQISTPAARQAFGIVDNASALTTTPQAQLQKPKRTFDFSYPLDIFMRQRHATSSSARPTLASVAWITSAARTLSGASSRDSRKMLPRSRCRSG